ncbi:Abi-domain-containing protein [Punctularia strigosozonata HHB-11173 SS5]|uniref:Abi-domain-containing protein n=1 Tax=Punctularia strigosozonata (strain HHB-11173) TaxID=741275 RepID=UPI0004417179|nr:Abi-domain-containing protein [Punctularia strigosozonata HHB-11173 SS5]EIN12707.1 Abi-domain-containing protein [Punctularia strigosozonata HHB-11173 SS5]
MGWTLFTYPEPPLSLAVAHACAFFVTASYVGILYASKGARLSNKHDRTDATPLRGTRDDPAIIRARLVAVSFSTFTSLFGFVILLQCVEDRSRTDSADWELWMTTFRSAILRLGLQLDLSSRWLAYLVTPMLFAGSLYAQYLFLKLPGQSRWTVRGSLLPLFNTWTGLRNFVFGPITEELVFRSCILAAYHLAGASKRFMIFVTPLWFGLAHVHHALETYQRLGQTPQALKTALVSSLFQFGYTTLFGFHAGYLFLRTSSIWPPIVAHVFCNIMGLPQISWEMKCFPTKRHSIMVMYILGVVGYIYSMSAWTRVPGSLYWNDNGY